MKLLSSNTRIANDEVFKGRLRHHLRVANSEAIQQYKDLRDQGRLATSEGQHTIEVLKRYWTPAIEDIHKATANAETSPLVSTNADLDYKASWACEPQLVESLRDLADAPVWTESVFNYIANLCVETTTRGRQDTVQNLSKAIFSSPWLVWRPPMGAQRRWLASAYLTGRRPIRPLRKLHGIYSEGDDHIGSDPVANALKAHPSQSHEDKAQESPARALPFSQFLHELNRLVMAGGSKFAEPTGLLLAVLGPDECRLRSGLVEGLCRELETGGREVATAWLSELGENIPGSEVEQDSQVELGASEKGLTDQLEERSSAEAAPSGEAPTQDGAEPTSKN